jgi:hypothetical protein
MPGYRITSEWMEVKGSNAFLARRHGLTIPIPPFPGLAIGCHVVIKVFVAQGGENQEIEVQYEPVSQASIKIAEGHGFTLESSE